MTHEFILGLWLGIAVAAPIGPMAILCIGRALSGGFLVASATGLGAATVHGLLGAVAVRGLEFVYVRFATFASYLAASGAILFLWLAIRLIRREAPDYRFGPKFKPDLLAAYLTACLLALSSPTTILLFLSSAPIVLTPGAAALASLPFVLGVFTASTLWWLGLSAIFGTLGPRLGLTSFYIVNRVAAIALAAFAASLLTSNAKILLQLLSQVSLADSLGFFGAAMTLLAFAQTQMLRMRIAAIVANLFFIGFGFLASAYPVLALHAVLLPLNLHRLISFAPPGFFLPLRVLHRSREGVP